MKKQNIILILLFVSCIASVFYFSKLNKKIKTPEAIPLKESKQEYILENLVDSINESFVKQSKTIGGQSALELRNNLSYVYENGKKERMNGVCVRYSKITSLREQINFPTFSFGPEYKKNIDYKPVGQKDYSVFYKEKKVSCEVIYTDQTEKVCCLYYNGPDPRSN